MALRNEDKAWIQNAIDSTVKAAVEPLRPSGWKYLLLMAGRYGSVASYIALVIALLALAGTQCYKAIDRITAEQRWEDKTDQRTSELEQKVDGLTNQISTLELSSLSSKPMTQQNLNQVAHIISVAAKSGQTIDKSAIAEVGAKVLEAFPSEPKARPVAAALLDYRSQLNGATYTELTNTYKPQIPLIVTFYTVPGYKGRMSVLGSAPPDESAELRPLTRPNPNVNAGNKFVLLEGGTVSLDGLLMKNVILKDVIVLYRGGDTTLDHVLFVNCKFEVEPVKNTERFVMAALSPDTTSVKITS